MAKMALRGVNFSCSLIVLSMLSTTFSIFNATKAMPPRNKFPPWASGHQIWPQVTLLCIACVSLAMSLSIIFFYYRGGRRRAEKAAVYYTVFAIGTFVFSTVMWSIGAVILNESRKRSNSQDMWGWSCKDGARKTLFQQDVDYALICRLQSWSLICAIIEITVEVITITIYAIVFYRFYSKRRLHKSMDLRDRARSDLYLAQLRSQSAPNTPGFHGPRSPSLHDPHSLAENGEAYNNNDNDESTQFASKHHSFSQPKPFALQPPPIRVQHATPAMQQDGFEPKVNEHVPAAPGEVTYEDVPIPGAYASPLASPSALPHQGMSFGEAMTAEGRGESPPGTPRFRHTRVQ